MNDIARRIRWGNLTRICAVGFAVAIFVAWPKLKAQPLALPPPVTVPVSDPVATPSPPATTPVPQLADGESPGAPVGVEREATVAKETHKRRARVAKRKRQPKKIQVPDPAGAQPAPIQASPKERPEFEPFG